MNRTSPGKLLAFVRPEIDSGPILCATVPFLEEIWQSGWDISDHDMPMSDASGLQIFEGWIELSGDPEPDPRFVGQWRQLTHWEMCRVRHGMMPFEVDE